MLTVHAQTSTHCAATGISQSHAPSTLCTQFTGAVFSTSSMDEASVCGEGGVRNLADGSRQNVQNTASHTGRTAMAPPASNEGGAAIESPEVDDVSMTDAMARDISEVADMLHADAWTFVPRGRYAVRRGGAGASLAVTPARNVTLTRCQSSAAASRAAPSAPK